MVARRWKPEALFLGGRKGKVRERSKEWGKVERSCPEESLSLSSSLAQGERWGWVLLLEAGFPQLPLSMVYSWGQPYHPSLRLHRSRVGVGWVYMCTSCKDEGGL